MLVFFPREVVCTGKSQSKFSEGLERVITNAYFERCKNFQLKIESLKCIDVFNKINNSTTLESSFFFNFNFNFNCFPLNYYYCYYLLLLLLLFYSGSWVKISTSRTPPLLAGTQFFPRDGFKGSRDSGAKLMQGL